jgi:hypothetical protein
LLRRWVTSDAKKTVVGKEHVPASADARRGLIDRGHEALTIRRQCELLDLPRSTFYCLPAPESHVPLGCARDASG